MSVSDDAHALVLRHRGVRDPCDKCKGYGVILYPSTATWRGGMGGAMMMKDVCDSCWGSGDKYRHWTDLRKQRAEENARIASAAADLLRDRCGVGLRTLLEGLDELCVELDKFHKQRRYRPEGFDTVTRCLGNVLRDMVAAKRAELAAEKGAGHGNPSSGTP